MPFLDPYTLVQRAIVIALNTYPAITNLFQPGNILDMSLAQFQNMDNPAMKSPQDSDMPQLIVLTGDGTGFKQFTSQEKAKNRNFNIIASNGTLNVASQNDLEWRVESALEAYQEQMTNFGLPNVYRVTTTSIARAGLNGESWARGNRRWFGVLTDKVEYRFGRGGIVNTAVNYPKAGT